MNKSFATLVFFVTVFAMGFFSDAARGAGSPDDLSFSLVIRESKLVYDSHVVAFAAELKSVGTQKESVECRDSSSYLLDVPVDLRSGWDSTPGWTGGRAAPRNQESVIVTCRNQKYEIMGWFAEARDTELLVSDELVSKDYSPAKLPLLVRVKSSQGVQFFSCGSKFVKTLTGETANYTEHTISEACSPIRDLAKKDTGIVDFVSAPGSFAAVAAYRQWPLPWQPITSKTFEATVDSLLKNVPAGEYSGAMASLGKTCDLKIERLPGKLKVTHTMTSTSRPRVRTLEITADSMLGAAEGPVFKDPNRVLPDDSGRMAAIEFKKDSRSSSHMMFEKRTDLDGLVVRLNGSEMYCRRLVKK